MIREILFAVLSAALLLQAEAGNEPNVCPKDLTLRVLLGRAGIYYQPAVDRYLRLFQQKRIDAAVLKHMTRQQLQDEGVTAYGDALRIAQYFGKDTVDNCAAVNRPCNGGTCIDGFKCFTCRCDPELGFHGPRCEQKCPCQNHGRCNATLLGIKCQCLPGFSGDLCENRWLTEDRFVALEQKSQALETKLTAAERKLEEVEQLARNRSGGFNLQRVDKPFPSLARVSLHQKTPTYTDRMPVDLPANTRAVIISVFCNFWNSGGHAYLNFDAYQKGNKKAGKLSVTNTHFKVYANTFYYELLAPWDSQLSDEMVFEITSTYQTGGNNNWYQVKLVGYITA